ncbi:hypothetical protein C8Q77DRAFT_1129958 [Trametes polyzona]|nr:hypothetical protein C8Q77DRAFT_1129958 [Trametes polyzona]
MRLFLKHVTLLLVCVAAAVAKPLGHGHPQNVGLAAHARALDAASSITPALRSALEARQRPECNILCQTDADCASNNCGICNVPVQGVGKLCTGHDFPRK